MIIKIAWRNIWRNPRRTAVLITTIVVGIFGFLGMMAFSRGFIDEMVDSTIKFAGHIQISADGFNDNPTVDQFLENRTEIENLLSQRSDLIFAPMVLFQGMVSSSETSSGVMINGIVPELERKMTAIADQIIEGNYLEKSDEVVIGKALADRLKVRLGEKIVLMGNGLGNEIGSGAFRVGGIFKAISSDFEKSIVYLDLKSAQKMIGYENQISSIIIRLENSENIDDEINQMYRYTFGRSQLIGKIEVLSWKDRFPMVAMSQESLGVSSLIIIVITFVAVAFTIVNTFLMVIYERIREIGIMMAIGVFPRKIRWLLFWEAIFVGVIGTAVGLIFSSAIIGHFAYHGLDLSAFSEGLSKYAIGSILKPRFHIDDLLAMAIGVQILVLISVLYPSIKASRFKIVDAIYFD